MGLPWRPCQADIEGSREKGLRRLRVSWVSGNVATEQANDSGEKRCERPTTRLRSDSYPCGWHVQRGWCGVGWGVQIN
jgi:hypothetical protein